MYRRRRSYRSYGRRRSSYRRRRYGASRYRKRSHYGGRHYYRRRSGGSFNRICRGIAKGYVKSSDESVAKVYQRFAQRYEYYTEKLSKAVEDQLIRAAKRKKLIADLGIQLPA